MLKGDFAGEYQPQNTFEANHIEQIVTLDQKNLNSIIQAALAKGQMTAREQIIVAPVVRPARAIRPQAYSA